MTSITGTHIQSPIDPHQTLHLVAELGCMRGAGRHTAVIFLAGVLLAGCGGDADEAEEPIPFHARCVVVSRPNNTVGMANEDQVDLGDDLEEEDAGRGTKKPSCRGDSGSERSTRTMTSRVEDSASTSSFARIRMCLSSTPCSSFQEPRSL